MSVPGTLLSKGTSFNLRGRTQSWLRKKDKISHKTGLSRYFDLMITENDVLTNKQFKPLATSSCKMTSDHNRQNIEIQEPAMNRQFQWLDVCSKKLFL
ncbi:hypothetical protein Tco_1532664 [Tanacetum coccineum]